MVVRNLGGMFAGTIERLGSWWSVALSAVLLAAPPLAVVWLCKQPTGCSWAA